MQTLLTKRLELREFDKSDVYAMNAYARQPEVGPHAGWKPHESLEETRAILADFLRKDEAWAIAPRGGGPIIGSIGLHDDHKRPHVPHVRMLGYVLAEEHWGKGYMTEAARAVLHYAFYEAGLSRVSVYHFPYNIRSQGVIKKCGFVYEGTLRGSCMRYDGTLLDDVCYSITKEEYTKTLKATVP